MNTADSTVDSKTEMVFAALLTLVAVAVMVMKALRTGLPTHWLSVALPISVAVYAYRRSRSAPDSPTAPDLLNAAAIANGSMALISLSG
jgi:hypothetical protein